MKTRLLNYWLMLRSSLWFIPTLMTLSAIALALLTIVVDRSIDQPHLMGEEFLYTLGPSGARTLLATVAGSVITVAGVVFSITIVALTLASSHFGPRLLKNFMKDMGNQVVLGTFIATFLYCLLVLGAIRENGDHIFVPHISVLVGLLLTLASMGVFIFFIHHISMSIHADTVVAGVSRELKASINQLFPKKVGESPPSHTPPLDDVLPSGFMQDSIPFVSRSSGYLQAIDHPGVMALAKKQDVLIQLLYRPGEFIVEGETIGKIWPPGQATEALIGDLQESFLIGSQRTEEQDIEFAIHQLVEVALRALSPGINDPFTAISCIDRLGDALTLLSERVLPSSCCYDEEHILRVITYPLTIDGIFDAAFNQLRQYGCVSVAVGLRLLEVFSVIVQNTDNTQVHQAIRRHATMVKEAMVDHTSELFDRREVEERYGLVLRHVSPKEEASEGGARSRI
ncbi:MAG: DUF2254 domain-containing protein [Nitrospirales bacterium]|nr:DUF2254 domain-containing protein [Nitrospirales bacterium]